MVRPEMLTVALEPISKTRVAPWPLSARFVAPGPAMLRSFVMSNSPVVSAIVPVTAKLIVSPSAASAMAWRKEPGPPSLALVTVRVAARPGFARQSALADHKQSLNRSLGEKGFFIMHIIQPLDDR